MPVTINEPQDELEFEGMKLLAGSIAEQNALVLNGIKAMTDAVILQAAQMADAFTKLGDALASFNIVVNVPEQPAPIINFTIPEMNIPPAQVTVKMPPEKDKKISMKIKRDRNGAIEGIEGTEK